MSNVYFTVSAIFFNVLLMILFYSKKRIKIEENIFYSGMILASFFGLVLDFISFELAKLNVSTSSIAYIAITKSMYSFILLWMAFITLYFMTTGRRYRNENQKWMPPVLLAMCITNIIVLLLPITIDNSGPMPIPSGIGINAIYMLASFYIFLMIISLLINIKIMKGHEYIPLYLIVILFITGLLVQKYYNIIVINSIINFITFVMYFTIENPDVKMVEQIELAKVHAETANQAKSDFLSSMSHEIRTPLNAIVGFSENLKELNLPSEAKEDVDDIVSASQTLLETVNGILDISKIEANKIEIIDSAYDFHKVFNDIVALSKARLGNDKPVEFRYKLDDNVPRYLYGDYARVKQVIINFLTNAIKYTQEGYIDFNVSCLINQDICRLIIKVEDSGMGIKKESIDKLFSKFERLENEKSSIEGTGLGLAITKKLVELMHGKINVQSIYGKGSQFVVTLDQKIVDERNIIVKETNNDVKIKNDISSKKVLIVDDNKLNLKVAVRLLKEYNLAVEEANSGIECIELIKKGNTYDLILMDDMMPNKNGKETFKELKTIPSFNIPVIMLTANAIEGMREDYIKEGFNDYLAKPIEREELNRIIKEYLDK